MRARVRGSRTARARTLRASAPRGRGGDLRLSKHRNNRLGTTKHRLQGHVRVFAMVVISITVPDGLFAEISPVQMVGDLICTPEVVSSGERNLIPLVTQLPLEAETTPLCSKSLSAKLDPNHVVVFRVVTLLLPLFRRCPV